MDIRQSIANQTDVSVSLAHRVFTDLAGGSNSVFSPASLNVVLCLIASGSKGSTLDQLLSFLKSSSADDLHSLSSQIVSLIFSDGSPSGGPRVSFVNSVWVDQSVPLKPSFKQVVDNIYKAASKHVDFQAKAVEVTNEVNSWAEKETGGLIKDILPPDAVDSSTRLILANALYFKGAWNEKFDASATKEYEFHLLDGTSVQAPFMTSKKKQLVRAFDGFKVLELPYKQGEDQRRFSMYLYLPDAKGGLPSLIERMNSESDFINRHRPHQEVETGKFRIPKFKIPYGFEASKILKKLGVVLPFAGGGLSEMVDSPVGKDLCVSEIYHKSFIEVDEEGTEAASASTAVIMLRGGFFDEKLDFVADHPFLFLIREDRTRVLLFMGQLLNPLVA